MGDKYVCAYFEKLPWKVSKQCRSITYTTEISPDVLTRSSYLNSSTIDELGEGAWKDGGASSTGAERVG